MANRVRLKRRVSGSAGAPATLLNGECAVNEVDNVVWYGKGLGQDGNATSVIAIGGDGVFATKTWVNSAISTVDVSSQLSNYLTSATAASTYLTQSAAASTYATPSFVASQITAVVGAAPQALDTLKELADALGSDASFSTTVTNSIAGKLAKSANLSDLADASAARGSLGLGSMATQSSSNVSITGGSFDNITIDSGSF